MKCGYPLLEQIHCANQASHEVIRPQVLRSIYRDILLWIKSDFLARKP
jgi:hypothetical protein